MGRRSVKPRRVRRVIFIGVEGKSDQALVRFLGQCCKEAGLHLHLDVKPGNGGDSVAVVEEAARYLRRSGKSNIRNRLVLLDRDRIKQDLQAGRDAQTVASRAKLKIIFQEPNLEGLLIRLHQGQENRKIAADKAMAELRKVWPEYSKQLTADQLSQRFALSDVQRAASTIVGCKGFSKFSVFDLSRSMGGESPRHALPVAQIRFQEGLLRAAYVPLARAAARQL